MKQERLNHFILWCKHWYEPLDKNEDLFTTAKKVLYLDDYCQVRNNSDVLNITLNYIDDMIECGKFNVSNSLRMLVWHQDIQKNRHYFNMSYEEALLLNIRNYLAFGVEVKNLNLVPPVYSKKVRKLGLTMSNKPGMTYKEMNNLTKGFKWAV